MKLHELKYTEGARRNSKRIGRGHGSGWGKTAGKGSKGQNARSGGGVALGFEGGQTPIWRRLPKRGFTNFTRKEFSIVNIELLNRFEDGATVNLQVLLDSGVLTKCPYGVKILGNGELTKKLTVQATAFSASAKEKIEAAGGKAVVI